MSKVVDSIEKDTRVFKKPQENREKENLFFNEQYFADVGFPGTKVYEGEMTEDGIMKGGYYYRTKILTQPFRQFVEFLQNEEGYFKNLTFNDDEDSGNYLNRVVSVEDKKDENVDKNGTGFFSRVGEYGNNINNYVKTTSNKLSSYFQKKQPEDKYADSTQTKPEMEVEPTPETESETVSEQKPETEMEPETETTSEQKTPPETVIEPESTTTSEQVKKKYWIVKIPIIKDDEFTPKGKYEKAEIKMNQILREEKIHKEIGKSIEGSLYEVGSKYVRICEEVKSWTRYEMEEIKLPGSRMSKIISRR